MNGAERTWKRRAGDKTWKSTTGPHTWNKTRAKTLAEEWSAVCVAVVKNVCDRVCVMQRGLFVDMGTSAEVFEHPQSDYTKHLLAAVPDVARALAARAP